MPKIGLKLLKFKEKKNKNDLYIIFPIPEVGLHLSLHGTSENNIHVHIRDKIGLGIDEDIPYNIYTNIEEWLEDITEFLYCPTRDSILLITPMPTMSELSQWGISFSKGEIRIDLFRLLLKSSEHFTRHAYFVKAKELLRQIPQLVQQDAVVFDLMQEKSVTFHKFKDVVFMLGYNVNNFQNQWEETKMWKKLYLPVERALGHAEKKVPHAFEKWGAKDMQRLEKFYSNKLDSISHLIKNRLTKLVDKKLPD